MKTSKILLAALLFFTGLDVAAARLAGFEAVDGYVGPFTRDVWSYDAGQTGALYIPSQYNTGRFKELLGSSNATSGPQYVSQHILSSGGNALAVRSNELSSSLTYDMSIQYDLGADDLGVLPTTLLSSATIDFDICYGRTVIPNVSFDTVFNNVPAFSLNVGGTNVSPGLTIGFTDHDPGDANRPQIFHVDGATYTPTAVNWSTQRFDHIQIDMDFVNQTFDLYWTKDNNTTTQPFDAGGVPQLVASNASFSSAMSNLDFLYFKAHEDPGDGISPAGLDKSFVDNFRFSATPVPEPSTVLLMLFGAVASALVRRPRRVLSLSSH